MNKELLISAALVIVLVVSLVQTLQLNTLKANIESGSVSLSSGSAKPSKTPSSGGSATLPSNIQDLPGMVGGC